jgi:hypothetical protein
VERFALGELGLMPSDFEELDLVELEMMSDGYFKRQEFELLKVRKIMHTIISVNTKKKINESDIFPLQIDEQPVYEKDELLTREEIEAHKKRIKWHKKK